MFLNSSIGISEGVRATLFLRDCRKRNIIHRGGVDIKWNGPLTALKGRRRLRYFSQIDRLPSVLGLVFLGNTYDWHGAPHWYFVIKFWTLLHETFTWIYRKYANTNNNSSIFRVFVVFSRKSSGKQIHAKTIWLKQCVKAYAGYEATSISSK